MNITSGNSLLQNQFAFCFTCGILVPTYVIFDCVNGGNLSDHLKEEFNPHRVHTYGNTPKKRTQVSENGKIESLPNYALQVAEGIKFLTKNKVRYSIISVYIMLNDKARHSLYICLKYSL